LNVPMDDAGSMRCVQGVGDLDCEIEQQRHVQRLAFDAALQSFAVQELHRDEGPAVCYINVVNGADIRMIEGGSSSRFTLEPNKSSGIGGHALRQEFQSDAPLQLEIFGLVDHAHPTAAEPAQNAVMRDDSAHQMKIIGTIRLR